MKIGRVRSFEEAVPPSVLQRKVRTYLEQSVALDERVPVDPPLLPGATSVFYDVIRSENPADFMTSAVC